jgi:single-strand DNA-binding protein
MLDAICSGKLIQSPVLRNGASGKPFASFLLSVSTGDSEPTVVSGIAFSEVAERIVLLEKGDSVAVIGSLKPSEWTDKSTGATKHGLSLTASNSISVYDIQKRRKPKPDSTEHKTVNGNELPYDDNIDF